MNEEDKLRIPDPEESRDDAPSDPGGNLVLAGALSVLLGLGIFVAQRRQSPPAASSTHEASETSQETASETSSPSDTPESRTELGRIAERLANFETQRLESRTWKARERVAAVRFGPRRVAEAACRTLSTPLRSDGLSDDVHREWLGAIDRRVSHAPWSCLLRYVLEGKIEASLGLHSEVKSFWNEMRVFQGKDAIVTSIVEDYRQSGDRPESRAFDRWLRLCGLNFDAPVGRSCRRLLKSIAPEEGRDLLGTVETHLRETDDLNPTYDFRYLLEGLAHLVSFGQPETWRIESTEALPDYDADLRLGAVLYLCRFVQSPRSGIVERSARALSQAAGISIRAVHDKLRKRWQLACKRAFRTNDDPKHPEAPILDVWSGNSDKPPRYALERVIESGACKVEPDKPKWYCASRRWRGSRADKLRHFFFETEYLKWKGEKNEFWEID